MTWKTNANYLTPIFNPPCNIISHAGYLLLYPQNTLLGCREAAAAGANGIEIDLRRSSDGVWCLCHEKNLTTLTNGTGTVNGNTWDYLSQLDAGYVFNGGQYAGRVDTKIPSFEQILTEFAQSNVLLYLDLKEFSDNDTYNPDNLSAHFNELITLINAHGMLKRCVFTTIESIGNAIKQLNPAIRTNIYYWGASYENSNYQNALNNAVTYKHEVVSWPEGPNALFSLTYVTRAMVQAFASAGVKLAVDTVTYPDIADKTKVYFDLGIEIITGDDPAAMFSKIHAGKLTPVWQV